MTRATKSGPKKDRQKLCHITDLVNKVIAKTKDLKREIINIKAEVNFVNIKNI